MYNHHNDYTHIIKYPLEKPQYNYHKQMNESNSSALKFGVVNLM